MTIQHTIRKSGAELPSASELFTILAHESSRQSVRFDFLSTHSSIFDAYHEISQLVNVDDSWIVNYHLMSLEDLVQRINNSNDQIASFIMDNSNKALYKRLYRSLIPSEDLSKSEAIFVFGAASDARIERAVELYNDGVAPKVIVSGCRPFYDNNTESEASRMSKFAIKRGIPESSLILEDKSITLPDNVKRSIDLLESIKWQPSTLTIVATNFVLQRGLMEWYKFTPWSMQVKTVSAHPQSQAFTEDGWHTDKVAATLVLNEYAKLILETKMDLLRRDSKLN